MRALFKTYPLVWLAIATNLLFSIFFLSLNYWHFPKSSFNDLLMVVGHWSVISLGSFAIVLLMILNRWVYLVLGGIYFLTTGIALYFVVKLDISLSPDLLHSILSTTYEEASGLVTIQAISFTIVLLVFFVTSAILRWHIVHSKKGVLVTFILLMTTTLLFGTAYHQRPMSFARRIPFSFYNSLLGYIDTQKMLRLPRTHIGDSAICNTDSMVVVLVIGEALRADHLQMNGYGRSTMPNMEKRGVVSLPSVNSIYSHTWHSVPHILTRADSLNPKIAYNESSFIDIFKNSGFNTSWIGNQIPDASFRYFVNECDTVYINKPYLTEFSNSKKLDSDLIKPFTKQVQLGSKQLALVHLVGNHWWYNSHFPDSMAVFKPIMDSKDFSEKNREKMINSYDNATLFTDHVLEQFIISFEQKTAVLIFLSDHGESFGENGKWLHANDNEPELNPACFIWLSDSFKRKFPELVKNLNENKNKPLETAFVFHSIVHAAQIQSPYLTKKESIFEIDRPQMEQSDLKK